MASDTILLNLFAGWSDAAMGVALKQSQIAMMLDRFRERSAPHIASVSNLPTKLSPKTRNECHCELAASIYLNVPSMVTPISPSPPPPPHTTTTIPFE